MKKRSFILFEILIAITLLSFLLIPLLSNPFHFYKKEMKNLMALTCLQLENEALFEIKMLLLQNKIPWDQFATKNQKEALICTLPSKHLIIKGFYDKDVPIYYRIWTKNEKLCINDSICKILNIEIAIDSSFRTANKPKRYHQLFVKKEKYIQPKI